MPCFADSSWSPHTGLLINVVQIGGHVSREMHGNLSLEDEKGKGSSSREAKKDTSARPTRSAGDEENHSCVRRMRARFPVNPCVRIVR
jgi:hypothetical protein